ncbi:MAG TPA: ATP-dependent helicase [Nonomuraea sp.]|nr:ATP-dependent helicase [Nonomuraea sp.]
MMGPLSQSINEVQANEPQRLVLNRQGHCVVHAPPGSGKTKLLATCLAYDVFNRIPEPQGAACITYTTAAADELRRRLASLGVPTRPSLFVGTVHSFAINRIIGPFATLAGKPELARASIASEVEQREAFEVAIGSVFGAVPDSSLKRQTIEFHRHRLSNEDEWREAGDGLLEACRKYEMLLSDGGLIDFEGVVAAAVELVEQHEIVRRVLTARYPRLYVDEYQDLTPGLDRLVRALCFGPESAVELLAVGDPEQAIFSWKGARPELLDELAGVPEVTCVRLEHNYRCGQEIIRVANRVQRGERKVTGERSGGEVSISFCPNGFTEQCDEAAKAVKLKYDRGMPLHDIAVICPQKTQCREVADALNRSGLAASVLGDEYPRTPAALFVESCAAWAMRGREQSGHRLGSIHRRWRRLLGSTWSRDKDVRLTELLLSYRDMPDTFASRMLADLLGEGLRRAVALQAHSDNANALHELQEVLEIGKLAHATVTDLAHRAQELDRVTVTTMSSSKGLEFEAVFILGADEGLMPFWSSLSDSAKLDEDRRKFYVSVTRARTSVKIFYSGSVAISRGRVKKTAPSRFLYEIGHLHL